MAYTDDQNVPGNNVNNLEIMLDLISEKLIQSEFITLDNIRDNQKTVRDGLISLGRNNSSETLILYQKDTKANEDDLSLSTLVGDEIQTLQNIASGIVDVNSIEISIINSDTGLQMGLTHSAIDFTYDITPLLTEIKINEDGTETIINPLNVSQFFNIQETRTTINKEQANEFLDTNIFELLPDSTLRQEQINQLFIDVENLLPPDLPEFDNDDNGRVDRNNEGDWLGSLQYYYNNSISSTQDNPDNSTIDEASSYITRLSDNASSQNQGKTIEDLRDRLNNYLVDIDEGALDGLEEPPEYQNQSSGYLKFRNLNQGIIIRNTNQEYIHGLNPETKDYLDTGFTITMWVRFLDKSSEGTLFNFGNPFSGGSGTGNGSEGSGFKLETYVINKDDPCPHPNYETWGDAADAIPSWAGNFFTDTETARFVRLVVNDDVENGGYLRDSVVGVNGARKYEQGNIFNFDTYTDDDEFRQLQTTHIPLNFQEWYFICATFNNTIDEDGSFGLTGPNGENYNQVPDFWMNHINPANNNIVVNSGYGNKCKVEIISRSDLLRARGYKVD